MKPALPDPPPRRPGRREAGPLILVSPDFEPRGVEFGDASLSLSLRYPAAVSACGGIPLAIPPTSSRRLVADHVRRCDGVLLTGGDDVNPDLHSPELRPALKRKAVTTPDGGRRDLFELLLLDEVFRQGRPLLAICRGHQLLNVALGGSLFVDLPSQNPSAINHRQLARKSEVVHSVRLTRGSLLAKIAGSQTLGVNSTHHQAVDRVAAGLQVVARSPDGVVEGMELARDNRLLPFLLSVQFHPERLFERHPPHRAVFKAFIQACLARTS